MLAEWLVRDDGASVARDSRQAEASIRSAVFPSYTRSTAGSFTGTGGIGVEPHLVTTQNEWYNYSNPTNLSTRSCDLSLTTLANSTVPDGVGTLAWCGWGDGTS